jgi:hypothetical protein
MKSLEAVVRRLRWSAARSSAVQYFLHAVLVAMGWVVAVMIAARLMPIEQTVRIAAYGVPIVFGVVAVVWIIARPGPMNLMRTADLKLGLKERLSTAWERRRADGPMDSALRQDALRHASRSTLAAAFPIGLRRREILVVVALALACTALLVLPNAMDQVLNQRRADKASQAQAAATIAAVEKKLAAAPSPAPVDPPVQKILQDARAKIAAAPDPRSALQNITPAEQQLGRLSDPQTAARATTSQNLANSLSTTSAGRNAGQAINTSSSKGAQAMRDLASQLQSLTPQQRDELAKALANAAQHAQDPAMASSMQRASQALASGDTSAAGLAMSELAGQLDSLEQQMNNDQEIAAAINGMEAARSGLAAQADRDASQSAPAGSPTAGAGGSGNAQASGSGSGSNGNGDGNGNGSGSGDGGSGTGNGGSGGIGNGSGSGSGSAAKPTEKLYVPGRPVPGQTENEPTPLGPGQDVPLTPYTQVVQSYQQAALDATNQTLIPVSARDLVRLYFSSLGEPGR